MSVVFILLTTLLIKISCSQTVQSFYCFQYFLSEVNRYSSGIPISWTSNGNENWFEKSGVRNIWGKIAVKQTKGNDFWSELSGFLRNRVSTVGRHRKAGMMLSNPRESLGMRDSIFTWSLTMSSAQTKVTLQPPPMRNEMVCSMIRKQGEVSLLVPLLVLLGMSGSRIPLSSSPPVDWRAVLGCGLKGCHQRSAGY